MNEIIIKNSVAQIRTKGKGKNFSFLIDEEDVNKILGRRWYLALYKNGYMQVRINGGRSGKSFPLSIIILGKKEGYVVDHVNRNTLDNRKSNLRYVTPQQNSWNRIFIRRKATTNNVGVYTRARHNGKFFAQICHNSKRIHLGTFTSLEDAVVARKAAEQKYYGEFAPI